ncbi:hypothetical protein ACFZBU_06750 [Embleya sp. NPDC008237]|uniref:hypothetical protein n=1 Tax=Embleya sp. NPDC008237 TaxID=3363978 RepID=UPI0036E9EF7E
MESSAWAWIRDYSYLCGFFGYARGVTPREVIQAANISGREPFMTTRSEAMAMDADLYEGGLTLLRAGRIGDWTYFMTALSAKPSREPFMSEISRNGDALGFYWDSMQWFTYARNGSIELSCDPMFGVPIEAPASALVRDLRSAVPGGSGLEEFFAVCSEHFEFSVDIEVISASSPSVHIDA